MSIDDFNDSTVIGNKAAIEAVSERQVHQAYLVVIQGPNVGEMFKVGDGGKVGRGSEVTFHLSDTEISREHAQIVRDGEAVFVEDLGSTNGTFVNSKRVSREQLRDGDKVQVGTATVLKFQYHDALEEQFQRKMLRSAIRDGLTGAYNKEYFNERLESELAFALRHQSPLCVIIFDLDHFKNINDTYGHLAGDYVLQTLAGGILQAVRKEDVFARYGGEEFAMLCRGIDQPGGLQFSERLRGWVERTVFVFEGQTLPVTISIGVAATPQVKVANTMGLIKKADEALYAAKNAGRNRVAGGK